MSSFTGYEKKNGELITSRTFMSPRSGGGSISKGSLSRGVVRPCVLRKRTIEERKKKLLVKVSGKMEAESQAKNPSESDKTKKRKVKRQKKK